MAEQGGLRGAVPVPGQQPQGIVQSENEEELPQCPGGQLWNHCARCVLTAHILHVQVIYYARKSRLRLVVFGRHSDWVSHVFFCYEVQVES